MNGDWQLPDADLELLDGRRAGDVGESPEALVLDEAVVRGVPDHRAHFVQDAQGAREELRGQGAREHSR